MRNHFTPPLWWWCQDALIETFRGENRLTGVGFGRKTALEQVCETECGAGPVRKVTRHPRSGFMRTPQTRSGLCQRPNGKKTKAALLPAESLFLTGRERCRCSK